MATAQSFPFPDSSGLNMFSFLDTSGAIAIVITESFIIVDFGTGTHTFRGAGIATSGNTVTGGTVTSIEYRVGNTLVAHATGLSKSAVTIANFYLANDGPGLLAYLLDGNDALTGSAADESLTGQGGNDVLDGGGGDDQLFGDGGRDTLNGGDGADFLNGGGGNDVLSGGAGNDSLFGAAGNDILIGGPGADEFDGGSGGDTVSYAAAPGSVGVNLGNRLGFGIGESQSDRFTSIENLVGSEFDDTLVGDIMPNVINGRGGDDQIVGNGGADRLLGGAGNDTLRGDGHADLLDGGAGFDTADYTVAGAVVVNLTTGTGSGGAAEGDVLIRIENLIAGVADDVLIGDHRVNALSGGGGNDRLFGLAGNDVIDGGSGDDQLIGGQGADNLIGGDGTDTANYAAAAARVVARLIDGRGLAGEAQGDRFTAIENLTGSSFNDVLIGNNGINVLVGGGGNDTLIGFGGDDALSGGAGNDQLIGGTGADNLNGGAGIDTVNFSGDGVPVDARLISRSGFAGFAAGDRYVGIENLTGTGFDDLLVGDNGANVLRGLAGADNLNGLGGNDTISGGDGDDRLTGHRGNDLLAGGAGNDLFVFRTGDGADRITDFAGGAGPGDRTFFANGATALNSFADVQAAASQVGANTVIDLGGGDTITLLGVMLASLDADDFLF